MKFVILVAFVAAVAAQTPLPAPGAVGPFPAQQGGFPRFGLPQPFTGFSPAPIPYTQVTTPSPIFVGKPSVPAPQPPVPVLGQYPHPHPHPHPQPHPHRPYNYEFIPIVRQTQDVQSAGYNWDYQSGNGIVAYEQAEIIPQGPEVASKHVQGGYSYTSPEGIPVQVTYTAGDDGFHPHVQVHIHGHPKQL